MRRFIPVVLLALFLVPAVPAAEKETLVDQVNKAIDEGVAYLKERQRRDGDKGHWEVDQVGRRGGPTCLALLALMYAGETPDSEAVKLGLNWLRDLDPVDTYVVGLQTMVFAEARTQQERDLLRIQKNVDWLIEAGFEFEGEKRDRKLLRCKGWGYHKTDGNADNSNSQYALLGLHAGKVAGAKVPPKAWDLIRDYYLECQAQDGGWRYRAGGGPIPTMTVAGVCGLLISGMEASDAQQKLREDGSARDCGIYKENEAVALGMQWIGQHFTTEWRSAWFYHLYGLERVLGRLSGQRFIGDYDWYRRGCDTLVDLNTNRSHRHAEDGLSSWYVPGHNIDGSRIVSTSFALLFLSKGRTPVLISKLVHYPQANPNMGWNNKHNDARHLVEYVNKLGLFKDKGRVQPVAWQIFNPRRVLQNDANDLAAQLLQTPIAYFNGHRAPVFTETEKKMLREYVEQGGFILAEACCGADRDGRQFDEGFRDLMKELWKDDAEHQLRKLPPNHPIYTSYALVKPDEFPLYGIEFGCKTQVVYSPRPLAGYWEANQTAKGTRGEQAFQLGANIIAYATGLEVPEPRGTEVEILTDKSESVQQRGFLKVAQLTHKGERQSTQGVTRNLMLHLRKKLNVDVDLKTERMPLLVEKDGKTEGNADLLNYKFLYMHGKGDFELDARGRKYLKADLEDGGLLFADACCGSKAFDASFRKAMKETFGRDLEPIDPDEELKNVGLFSAELNRTAITSVKCRRESGKSYENVKPALEGIRVWLDDKHKEYRWVVIYSRYDIGCALEKHQSSDCLGHDYESALRLGSAVVLYALQR